jgi:flagellar basal body-associated protein FliL
MKLEPRQNNGIPVQTYPPIPTDAPPIQGAEIPPSNGKRKSSRSPLIVIGLVVAFALALAGAVAVGVVSQSGHLREADEATSVAQSETANIRAELTASETSVSDLQSEASGLQSKISAQETRLGSCATANSLSVDMDKIMHDLVSNALLSGSLAEWNTLFDRYDALGARWATAADQCDPSGGFSFD